jgi:hypothetical protein
MESSPRLSGTQRTKVSENKKSTVSSEEQQEKSPKDYLIV